MSINALINQVEWQMQIKYKSCQIFHVITADWLLPLFCRRDLSSFGNNRFWLLLGRYYPTNSLFYWWLWQRREHWTQSPRGFYCSFFKLDSDILLITSTIVCFVFLSFCKIYKNTILKLENISTNLFIVKNNFKILEKFSLYFETV